MEYNNGIFLVKNIYMQKTFSFLFLGGLSDGIASGPSMYPVLLAFFLRVTYGTRMAILQKFKILYSIKYSFENDYVKL